MKNQYFGDRIDLFKYDFITKIMEEISSLDKFAFITMLTPNDERNDGNKRKFKEGMAGYKNDKLRQFLEKWGHGLPKELRDFRKIGEYFKEAKIVTHIYDSPYFTNKGRNDYFERIDKELLENSLIFVDPDNGMEIKNATERHILYSEMKLLYTNMSRGSLLMVIQFKPMMISKAEWQEKEIENRANALLKELGDLPVYIYDYNIAFFILSKDEGIKKQLSETILRYNKEYN